MPAKYKKTSCGAGEAKMVKLAEFVEDPVAKQELFRRKAEVIASEA